MRRPLLLACLVGSIASCGDAPLDLRSSALPREDVRLVVDRYGITHVYAVDDGDAFYGAGYAMARDRLFQMELGRRRAKGTLAEVLGPTHVKDDVGARTLGFLSLGVADVARVRAERPDDARMLDAFVAGVNARIAEVRSGKAPRPYGLGPDELDFVPEDWTPEEPTAIAKVLSFGLSSSLDSEILATLMVRLAPDFTSRYPLVMPAFDTFPVPAANLPTGKAKVAPSATAQSLEGWVSPPPPDRWLAMPEGSFASNNWAVTGAHTDNGRPYVAGDPHQALTSPTRLWPLHMRASAGTIDAIGFAFVGTPTVELGHNAHVGWTATTNFADVMDMWGVATDDDETHVLLGDGAHPIVRSVESIRVKGEDAPRTIDVDRVPGYGVLLPPELLPVPRSLLTSADAILFQWTGFQPTRELSAFLAMDRAKSLDEWERGVDLVDVGAENFVGADRNGVSYHVHGVVPDRGDPSSKPMPWRILSGDDARTLWTGQTLSADKLPHVRDPERGFIATANTDPFGFTADGSVEDDPYYYGAFYANGFREFRMDQALSALLADGHKVTRGEMEALQRDVKSVLADAVLPHLADAIAAIDGTPALAPYGTDANRALAASLLAWDRTMKKSRGEPLAFTAFSWFLVARLLGKSVPDLLIDGIGEKSPPFFLGAMRNILDDRFEGAKSFMPAGPHPMVLAALDDARGFLVGRFGTSDPAGYTQASIHAAEFPTSFGGRLDVGRFPVDGGSDTINVAPAPFFARGGSGKIAPLEQLTSVEMSLYRMVIGFGDDGVPAATFDFARGASEDPDSPHFSDRQQDWLDAKHVPLPFRDDDIAMGAEPAVTLPSSRGAPAK